MPPVHALAGGPAVAGSIDVLCVGHASYDLVFAIPHHPTADEKIFADQLVACGGGPAANAAVTVARLGGRAAFAGFLGSDLYGDAHFRELVEAGVETRYVARGPFPTPLSAVLVKPDGSRSLVNHKGATPPLTAGQLTISPDTAKVLLLDGHEPLVSVPLAESARRLGVPVVLDAGSVHPGTSVLHDQVDCLACSEKFARQYLGGKDEQRALQVLGEKVPAVVITLGEHGLVWRRGAESGKLPAFEITAVDSTGAGDAFHGALALALARELPWEQCLRFASAAGALCCTRLGARSGIPRAVDVECLLQLGEAA
ncbi:MAG: carbohydrate kinase [Methylococcaceae bacterium]|nr:carbohydrate kinase [Methylococcaceae bacterium]